MGKLKHGESASAERHAARLYNIWATMRNRCSSPHSHNYIYYGGRGIRVCEDWNQYLNFKSWAMKNGYSDELSIDRIDANGDYCPENCKWSTPTQQARNRRNTNLLTFNGETKPLAEWAEILNINYRTLYGRINSGGFTTDEAMMLPINTRRRIRNDGITVQRNNQGRFA